MGDSEKEKKRHFTQGNTVITHLALLCFFV